MRITAYINVKLRNIDLVGGLYLRDNFNAKYWGPIEKLNQRLDFFGGNKSIHDIFWQKMIKKAL